MIISSPPTNISGLVPYTGATAPVNLGANKLTVNDVDFADSGNFRVEAGGTIGFWDATFVNQLATIDNAVADKIALRQGVAQIGAILDLSSLATTDKTFTFPNASGTIALGTGTINELTYWSGANTLGTLAVATYPSLTELSYVKGVTSALQTQLGLKAPLASPTFTGTVTLPSGQALIAPALGTPASGTLTNCTFPTLNQNTTGSAASLSATLAIASGGTGATTLAGASIATYTGTETLTNKRITPKSTTEASSATPTINTDNTDIHTITALAVAITSFTTNLTGTPTNGQKLIIRILDNATARAIAWGASFVARGVALPTTTVLSKYLYVGFIYNSTAAVWDCIASVTES